MNFSPSICFGEFFSRHLLAIETYFHTGGRAFYYGSLNLLAAGGQAIGRAQGSVKQATRTKEIRILISQFVMIVILCREGRLGIVVCMQAREARAVESCRTNMECLHCHSAIGMSCRLGITAPSFINYCGSSVR